jgi:signal transduction histidine kinase
MTVSAKPADHQKSRAAGGGELGRAGSRETAIRYDQLFSVSGDRRSPRDCLQPASISPRSFGLRSTIEANIEKIAASSDIRFTVEVAPIDELFSKEDEINIYRIVQECVNNILRHSQATEARVVVNRTGDVMQITVTIMARGLALTNGPKVIAVSG